MSKQKPLEKEERTRLINELADKYAHSSSKVRRWTYFRKKYFWLFVVNSTKCIKRLLDIVISAAMLVIFSPLMLLVAILIKIYDGGPVIYSTYRVGMWGKEFLFPKFRSMQPNAEQIKDSLLDLNEQDGTTFKIRKDPRVTPLGTFLRKSSIDELPQLWCVLKGEMSLVGPRPPLPEEVATYSVQERARLEIKPGLTCLWQVSGRSDLPFNQQLQLDKEYIASQSIWLDIIILLKTIPAVLFGRGAY